MFTVKNLELKPAAVLRFGLGLVLIYAGIHMFFDPLSWLGFVPAWLAGLINAKTFLYIHAVAEFFLGLFLLFDWLTSLISFLVFADFLVIILFYGIDEVTFRDFGLMMAALSLFLLVRSKKENK